MENFHPAVECGDERDKRLTGIGQGRREFPAGNQGGVE